MRQARAMLTRGSPTLGNGVVRWWSKEAWKMSVKVSWGQILLCLLGTSSTAALGPTTTCKGCFRPGETKNNVK